ncbi:MAG: hypothetical protein KAJ40_05515 [Alphaproteobacteria bacterium]|nr:hypothetical protein [Alphaproteobacteria bacterium]
MSIPDNTNSGPSEQRGKNTGDVQTHMLLNEQDMANNLNVFAFLIALFENITGKTGLGSNDAIEGFSKAFNIDATKLNETVENYRSGNISAFNAAYKTRKSIDIAKVDMAQAEKVVVQYAEKGNPLLELIADKESGDNYNRVYGKGVKTANLTDMTVNEVLKWQKEYVKDGSPSSAAGRYQIIQGTLAGLKKEMGLSGNELYDESMQDRMAMHLLNGRGYQSYLKGTLSEDKFMRELSKEWAAMPKDGSGASYYAGDGLNKALVSPATMLLAMRNSKNITIAQGNNLTNTHGDTIAEGGVKEEDPSQPKSATLSFEETISNGGTNEAKQAGIQEDQVTLFPTQPPPITPA